MVAKFSDQFTIGHARLDPADSVPPVDQIDFFTFRKVNQDMFTLVCDAALTMSAYRGGYRYA